MAGVVVRRGAKDDDPRPCLQVGMKDDGGRKELNQVGRGRSSVKKYLRYYFAISVPGETCTSLW